MRPLVSRCAAINSKNNPTSSRCKKVPGKNGYFCDMHWNLLHTDKIMAIKIRGIPHIVGSSTDIYYVYAINDKNKIQKKVAKPEVKKEVNKADVPVVIPDNKSRIIDYTNQKDIIQQNNVKKISNEVPIDSYIISKETEERIKDYADCFTSDLIAIADAFGIDISDINVDQGLKTDDRKKLIIRIIKKESENDKT